MGQKKGNTGNPAGRPKGSKNKVSTELKTWVQMLITSNTEQLEKDLQSLEPNQKWVIIEKLLQFVIPKATIHLETKDTTPPRPTPPARILRRDELKEYFEQLEKEY
ncbi:MAG: hypothetical protein FD155_558 [Bacteroidetes bacterium]|nr:MAG: hypothetical protein FD155_558 [Bacteroidota bacterium]